MHRKFSFMQCVQINLLGQLYSELPSLEGAPIHRVDRILSVVPDETSENFRSYHFFRSIALLKHIKLLDTPARVSFYQHSLVHKSDKSESAVLAASTLPWNVNISEATVPGKGSYIDAILFCFDK